MVVVPLAGCTTTHARTIRAADRLERSANTFAGYELQWPHAADSDTQMFLKAREFADEAHDFRRTIDTAGDAEVVLAFERLWRSYHAVLQEITRARNREARADLRPVTERFVDVQREVKNAYSYADNALYPSGGYQFDPYYN
jgi:hypothetical protein